MVAQQLGFAFSNIYGRLGSAIGAIALTLISCGPTTTSATSQPIAQTQPEQATSQQWRQMSSQEESQAWQYVLNSPMGIAALNRLAIEGFISPTCPKTFYVNEQFGGFQTLLQVTCPDERGVSIARPYSEMRVLFNRFEDNIENFEVERVYPD